MSSSIGKRERERQKLERAQAKTQRKAARQLDDGEVIEDISPRSEAELVEELQVLHQALETGEVSLEDFGTRRDRIQAELERLLR